MKKWQLVLGYGAIFVLTFMLLYLGFLYDSLISRCNDIESRLDSLEVKLKIPSQITQKLLFPIGKKETNFDFKATGDYGKSHGAYQIQLRTANFILSKRNLKVSDLYDPYVNPFLAAEYLEYLRTKHKQVKNIVAAYSGGLKKIRGKLIRVNDDSYVKHIMSEYDALSRVD